MPLRPPPLSPVLVLASLLCLSPHAAVPAPPPTEVSFDFENIPPSAAGEPLVIPGLTVRVGSLAISTETAAGGTHALALLPSSPPGQVKITLPPDLQVCFVQLYIRPVPSSVATDEAGFDIGGAQGEFIRVDGQGELYVRNAPDDNWRLTGARWTENGGARWLRLNLRIDRLRHKWDLFADGRRVATNMGLAEDGSPALTLYGNLLTPVLVDNIYAGPADPLFAQSQGGVAVGTPRENRVVLDTVADKHEEGTELGKGGKPAVSEADSPDKKKPSQDEPAKTSRLKVFTRSR